MIFELKQKHTPYLWAVLGFAIALPKNNYWPLLGLTVAVIGIVYWLTK